MTNNPRCGVCGKIVLILALLAAGYLAEAQALLLPAGVRTLHVGKGQEYPSVAAVARVAKDGDVIEIEAGDYWRDVAVWTQNRLTLRGVHGRVRMMAAGASAEGKATWVFRGGEFLVENIEFSGSRVADRNGAGIRLEHGYLVLRNCVFVGNEMGLLTSNDGRSTLEIEGSEFGANDFDDERNHHNLYVGQIARLQLTSSYFHHGRTGHLFKSRARENFIFYNRLTDEIGGRASYEMEFPNGGIAYVVGNIVQQDNGTENPYMISYGVEGYHWPRNELYLVNNTLVDDKARNGMFLRVSPGAQIVRAVNNLLLGSGDLASGQRMESLRVFAKTIKAEILGQPVASVQPGTFSFLNNPHAEWSDVALEPRYDYRLGAKSPLRGKAVDAGEANGVNLRPDREYVHPRSTRPIAVGTRLSPGALQAVAP
jgi:hypothetical protein